MHAWTVPLERHEVVSGRSFDDVLGAIRGGLGTPDFAALSARLAGIGDWRDFVAAVTEQAGSSGLMVFLELDLGGVVGRDPAAEPFRAVRIIAGNPVTMESMVRTSPGAGAFAPVTILLFERADGVHVRYDTLVSGVGEELDDAARAHAEALDEAVLALLATAAGTRESP